MQGKVGDGPGVVAAPPTELKTLGIQGLKKQLEAAAEAEKLTANGGGGDDDDDEAAAAKAKADADAEEAEGPVVVEEEYQDVVMSGPQGGLFSK